MKNKIKNILLEQGFNIEKFPVDIDFTEVAPIPESNTKKHLLTVEMADYPFFGYSVNVPQKALSKILNPNKILSE